MHVYIHIRSDDLYSLQEEDVSEAETGLHFEHNRPQRNCSSENCSEVLKLGTYFQTVITSAISQ